MVKKPEQNSCFFICLVCFYIALSDCLIDLLLMKYLGIRGRFTLVQLVLSSISLSLFKVLVGVANKIGKLMRSFLREGVGEGKKDLLIIVDVVSLSEDICGLVFRTYLGRECCLACDGTVGTYRA